MKRHFWYFIAAGLGVSLGLAAVFSPFASSSPDGLEKVAEDKGFLEKGEGEPAWKHSPAPEYAVPGLASERIATGAAGFAGTALVFAAGWVFCRLLVVKHNAPPPKDTRHDA